MYNLKSHCCKCYNKYANDSYCHYDPTLPRYPYNFSRFPFSPNVSKILDVLCDGTENFILDQSFPDQVTLSVNNLGDCPAQIWIYYTEGFYLKRLGLLIDPGQSHKFDTIYTVMKISITCNPIRCQCRNCNSNGNVDHCRVDYYIVA